MALAQNGRPVGNGGGAAVALRGSSFRDESFDGVAPWHRDYPILATALGLLVAIIALAALWQCRERLRERLESALETQSQYRAQLVKPTPDDELGEMQTRIFIETDSISCDFTVNLDRAAIRTLDSLISAAEAAGYEATQEAIDLCDACVESLDHSGNPTAVTTDADCRRLLDAPGIRFTDVARSGRGGASTRSSDGAAAAAAVQVLLSPSNADSGDMAGGQGGFANVD